MRLHFSIFGLIGLSVVGACQNSDISFLEPAKPQVQAESQSPNPIASGPPQSLENPQTSAAGGSSEIQSAGNIQTAQPAQPAAAQQGPVASTAGQQGTVAGQGSLSQAAGNNASNAAPNAASNAASGAGQPEEGTTRVELTSEGSGFAAGFRHEVSEMFGGTTGVRVNDATNIQVDMVLGNWNLTEEDGMRTCAMAFATSEEENRVEVTPGCSQEIAAISEWGVFGEDLLLRDSQNSVVVRMHQSTNSWVGFTLATGIPIVLTR